MSSTHGGARINAGRPPFSEPTKNVTVRLTNAQQKKLQDAGGSAFLQKLLDRTTIRHFYDEKDRPKKEVRIAVRSWTEEVK